MSEDSTPTKNPYTSQADFTYSITPKTLTIKDSGKGTKSAVEDLAAVLRRIEHWHQDSVARLKLAVVDPEDRKIVPEVTRGDAVSAEKAVKHRHL